MHRPRLRVITTLLGLCPGAAACGDDGTSADGAATSTGPSSTATGSVTSTATTIDDGTSSGPGTGTAGPANNDPNAADDLYRVADDAGPLMVDPAGGVLANDTDPDGDTLAVTFDAATIAGGTLSGNPDGSFVYTPPTPFWGEDGFTYTIDDGRGGFATAQARVLVSPTAVPVSAVAAGIGGFAIEGDVTLGYSGWSVGNASDIDGDGLADLIIGAPYGDTAGALSGRAYVVLGKANTTTVSLAAVTAGTGGFVLNPEAAGDRSGGAVGGSGDVDGDGLADVIVGAWGSGASGVYSGRSYVVWGKAGTAAVSLSNLAAAGFVIDGEMASDQSGRSVSTAGDVNGDGLADLLIGAPNAASFGGRAYVVFGKAGDAPAPLSDIASGVGGFALDGTGVGGRAGRSVSGAGDVNGDGLDDLIVGGSLASPNGALSGRSFVVFGKANTASVSLADVISGVGGFVIDGEAAGDRSGEAVSGAGDVNGDGLADLIVGALYAAPAGVATGRSYIVFGKADTATVSLSDIAAGTGGFVLDGETADDESGHAVSGAGDLNGDGLTDVIVGAPLADPGGLNAAGRSYVVFGKADTMPVALSDIATGAGGFAIDGEQGSFAGHAVGGGGDFNGDGFADVVIGAPLGGVGVIGVSYVVFGGEFLGP